MFGCRVRSVPPQRHGAFAAYLAVQACSVVYVRQIRARELLPEVDLLIYLTVFECVGGFLFSDAMEVIGLVMSPIADGEAVF